MAAFFLDAGFERDPRYAEIYSQNHPSADSYSSSVEGGRGTRCARGLRSGCSQRVNRSGIPKEPRRRILRVGLGLCWSSAGNRVRNLHHLLFLIQLKRDHRPPQYPRRLSPPGQHSRLSAAGSSSPPVHAPDGNHLCMPSPWSPPQSELSCKLSSYAAKDLVGFLGDVRIPFLTFWDGQLGREACAAQWKSGRSYRCNTIVTDPLLGSNA